jgi:hypothetical protein
MTQDTATLIEQRDTLRRLLERALETGDNTYESNGAYYHTCCDGEDHARGCWWVEAKIVLKTYTQRR